MSTRSARLAGPSSFPRLELLRAPIPTLSNDEGLRKSELSVTQPSPQAHVANTAIPSTDLRRAQEVVTGGDRFADFYRGRRFGHMAAPLF
jgi:hypothetical protein